MDRVDGGLASLEAATLEPLDVECMRCHAPVRLRFYGLCPDCTAELHASMRGDARAIEVEAFEPAMHVTPNAVALKDD